MKVRVASVLDCEPELVWEKVQTSALLLEVAWPVLRITPVDVNGRPTGWPEKWTEGLTVRCKIWLFGLIPFIGVHRILFRRVDFQVREIQTEENDPLIRKWEHRMRVEQAEGDRTLYSDEIEMDAGVATPLVWLFAFGFYRHRHRKWRNIAKHLANA